MSCPNGGVGKCGFIIYMKIADENIWLTAQNLKDQNLK